MKRARDRLASLRARSAHLTARRHAALDYAALYEDVAAIIASDAEVVGGGDFDRIGRIELAFLIEAGLRPTDTLVDFGCGTGRLALHAIPYLDGGDYVGIEISPTILERGQANVAKAHPDPPCRVTWVQNTATTFPLPDASADVICAFSVFTHMEHEDTYRYLVDAIRVARPGGRVVFSCLPLELEYAQRVFKDSAALALDERWSRARNVATSRDFMDAIASLAGWEVRRWFRGDDAAVVMYGLQERAALGQSVCILQRPSEP